MSLGFNFGQEFEIYSLTLALVCTDLMSSIGAKNCVKVFWSATQVSHKEITKNPPNVHVYICTMYTNVHLYICTMYIVAPPIASLVRGAARRPNGKDRNQNLALAQTIKHFFTLL